MVNARYFTNVGDLLLKAYAFIGIFSIQSINQFMSFWVWVRTKFCLQISVFICRNVYRNSIYDYADFNALEEMNPSLISAST